MKKEDIIKLAHLSRLVLDDGDVESTGQKVGSILSYVGALEAISVDGVPPMAHVHGVENVFRSDQAKPSLEIDDALRNAPDKSGRFFRVPIIIEQEE